MAVTQTLRESLYILDAAVFSTLTLIAGLAISTIGLALYNIVFVRRQEIPFMVSYTSSVNP